MSIRDQDTENWEAAARYVLRAQVNRLLGAKGPTEQLKKDLEPADIKAAKELLRKSLAIDGWFPQKITNEELQSIGMKIGSDLFLEDAPKKNSIENRIEDLGESLLIDLTLCNEVPTDEDDSEDQSIKGKKRTKSPKKPRRKVKLLKEEEPEEPCECKKDMSDATVTAFDDLEPKDLVEELRSDKIRASDLCIEHLLAVRDVFGMVDVGEEVLRERIEILLEGDERIQKVLFALSRVD